MSGVRDNMLQRCTNPKATSYEYYGGRGISVCNRWRYGEGGKSGSECFLEDMGPRPDGLTLERRDGDRNYEPPNCYWATRNEQNLNRRRRPGIRRIDMTANKPFQMRCTDEFWRDVDAWRRVQLDLPHRAEAIRRLVAIGLRADPPNTEACSC
jgi:hypothetical protein